MELCGLPPSVGAWSLAAIGLFNILGSLWIGHVITSRRMKLALAWIYFARALIILAFFFAPKTTLSFLVFGAAIGFTYLSTVPPTIGLVIKFYGPRYVATLFGVVMLSHQVGGFLGAGSAARRSRRAAPRLDVVRRHRALPFAAAVHLPIREARPAPLVAAAA